jgi:hypothetical protein
VRSALDVPPAFKPGLKLACVLAAFFLDDPVTWGLVLLVLFWDIALDMRTAAMLAYPEVRLERMDDEGVWLVRSQRCAWAVKAAVNAFVADVAFLCFLSVLCILGFYLVHHLCYRTPDRLCLWLLPKARLVVVRGGVFVAMMVVLIVRDLFVRRWRRLDRLYTARRGLLFFAAGSALAIPAVARLVTLLLRVLWAAYAIALAYLALVLKDVADRNRLSFYSLAFAEEERSRIRAEHMRRLDRFLRALFGPREEGPPRLDERRRVRLLTSMEALAAFGALALLAVAAASAASALPLSSLMVGPDYVAAEAADCMAGEDGPWRVECLTYVAAASRDARVCEPLSDAIARDRCRGAASSGSSRPSPSPTPGPPRRPRLRPPPNGTG